MLNLKEVSAWIEVDGEELEQYGVTEDLEKSEVTCWIATQAGKAGHLNFDVAPLEHSLASYLILDGTGVQGRVLPAPTATLCSADFAVSRTMVQNDFSLSTTSARPFLFSKLELTDEDEYYGQASKHLGEIQLVMYRVAITGSGTHPDCNVAGQGKVHERSKKAVSHCVSYGQEMKMKPRTMFSIQYLDAAPLATFTFKYRDYSLLQANGIVPKPPATEQEPATSEEVLDLTIDDDVKQEPAEDEIRALDNAIRTMRKQRATLLSKRLNSSPTSSQPPVKRIKREEKFIPTGEVIDLT
ncbi:hypothetical protein PAXINDRAFT_13813 [Paxillus involutus ATCC 200175]|uniref:Unplaced genomic scaffold PAXINscaffold_30, whole genome shotgun sequence n=1 Tax=Paxillus involutus ATCC 200175 TaxID=664439 RepID=A0A0C9TT87_PAXIN|nr:hypothetical protein PAXINDRAFT_13813 [Paxillus involutus ATCC 200175]